MSWLRRLIDWIGRSITPRRTDTVLAVLLVLGASLELVISVAESDRLPWVPSLLAGLVAGAAVAWRRRSPVVAAGAAYGVLVAASASALVANGQFSGNRLSGVGGFASIVLLYSAARYASGRTPALLVLLGFGSSVVDQLAVEHGIPYGPITSSLIFLGAVAGIGVAFRYRADLRAEREVQARTGEREQLARELHDVVAHHVSAMVVQASAALAVLDQQPEAARPALRFIKESGQATMGEMRQMVGILRGSGPAELAPRRGIAGLADLLLPVPGAAPVRLHEVGSPQAVDGPVDQSVVRIVQESVTNARRHGRLATAIDVTLTWSPERLEVRVENDGAPAPVAGPADGYGLVGMAERARLLHGTFDAGPRPGGGWRVQATFPVSADAPPPDAPSGLRRSDRPPSTEASTTADPIVDGRAVAVTSLARSEEAL